MILRVSFIILFFRLSHSFPTTTINRNGTRYSLNAGHCESFSCGEGEGRGRCIDESLGGRPAHFCVCSHPFTGSFCDDTVPLFNPSLSPYAKCPSPLHCSSVYGNGECNQECNSPECLYDGYECLQQPVCPKYCRELASNGICDDLCKGEECRFDGGDCFSDQDTLPGQLLLRFDITAQAFMKVSDIFLFQLSHFLGASTVLSSDSEGPLIWEWIAWSGTGSRINKDDDSSVGIEVAVSVALTNCPSHCTDSLDMAVRLVAETLAAKSSPISSAQIVSVSSSHHSSSPLLAISIALLFLLVAVGGLIEVVRRKRKRVLDAPVWTPPVLGEEASPVRHVKQPRISFPRSRLHLAAMSSDPLFVLAGEEVDGRDDGGCTPLLLATQSERLEESLRETIILLIKAGADLQAIDKNGRGALHHSLAKLRSPSFNQWMLSLGANPLVVDSNGKHALHISSECSDLPNLQLMLKTDAYRMIDMVDDSNRTALSISIYQGTPNLTRCLLDCGADVNCDGEDRFDPSLPRKCPIHLAIEFRDKEHVLMLISRGCRMTSRDYRGRTPLHYAVLHAHIDICRIVVDAGTPVDVVDDEDRSAEEMAADLRLTEIRDYLISVRGKNEPWIRKRDRKPKRYSSDQGYGSEESQLQPSPKEKTPSHPTTVLTQISTPTSHVNRWGALTELPFFSTGPFTEMSTVAIPLHDIPMNSSFVDPLNGSSSIYHPNIPPPFISPQ